MPLKEGSLLAEPGHKFSEFFGEERSYKLSTGKYKKA